ncbi:MAG: hypothetical protein HC852_01170 [Acaryochloridaceae cyanobacterium RU_4_10]|nr:hypothetical protein [Acaryochloridaceae cyanobacterium RU_4_10]
MDDVQDVLTSPALNRLILFAYLVPVFGMIPAAWTLTRGKSDRRHRSMSRLALTLGLVWGLGCLVFNTSGVSVGENGASAQMSMLLFNSVFTSGYFVTSLWLMVRLWKRQTLALPGLSSTKHSS